MMMYKVLNVFFFVFHIGLILFNLFGWMKPSWRKWNLVTLVLTALSWFLLGIFYGFGYCFLTDWHWEIREKLGYQTESDSYIHFLLTELLPISISEKLVDTFTAILFFMALAISIFVNVKSSRVADTGK